MAKNPAPVAKSKTAAQITKRDRNIAEAAERLKRMQAKQKLVKELRGKGYTGTDDQIIQKFMDDQRKEEAQAYVNNVLTVPVTGGIIKRWLKDRINQSPIHVQNLIIGFLNRDGSKPGHKDNSGLKADVENYLGNKQDLRIIAHKQAAA